jgi:hypothetical protein
MAAIIDVVTEKAPSFEKNITVIMELESQAWFSG